MESTTSSGTSGSTSTMTWAQPDGHPLDDEARPVETPAEEAPPTRRRRGLGSNRHLGSIVVSLLAVPAAYGFIDYGYYRATTHSPDGGDLPQMVVISLIAAAGLMLLASLAGRVSAAGPLLAGLVWGVGPLAWVLLDFSSYVDRLNDLPELYPDMSFGLYSAGFALYPAVAGLLIGTAIAGRWRRHHPAPGA